MKRIKDSSFQSLDFDLPFNKKEVSMNNKRFLVLHHSDNWIDGLSIKRFESKEAVNKYLREFKSKYKGHSKDRIEIVDLIASGTAEEIDHGLFGFKVQI